jgi:hypothetical protein
MVTGHMAPHNYPPGFCRYLNRPGYEPIAILLHILPEHTVDEIMEPGPKSLVDTRFPKNVLHGISVPRGDFLSDGLCALHTEGVEICVSMKSCSKNSLRKRFSLVLEGRKVDRLLASSA